MKLSTQAMGALMLALQKCLLEQKDIVPILEEFNFNIDENECLTVVNPPTFKIDNEVFSPETEKTTGSD